MSLVYKILPRAAWEAAQAAGVYRGSALDLRDGYIHLSSPAQVGETARRHFAGQEDLLVLAIEAGRLGPALRWEASRGGDLFPHLYGDLDPRMAASVTPAPLDADGVPVLEIGA